MLNRARFVLKTTLLLLMAFWISFVLPSRATGVGERIDIRRITSDALKKFPGSEAVVIYDSLIVKLNRDGTISRRYHRLVALFTDDGIRRYGDPRILFNSDYQNLNVETARVYMRDGTVVDTGKNGINQTTPFSLASAWDFTSWHEMVVTHVGIEKGCLAELCYTIEDMEKFYPSLSGSFVFNGDDPIQLRVFRVTVPDGLELKHLERNGAPEPSISDDGRVLTWKVENLEPGARGKGLAPWEDYLPVVYYSTEGSWEDVSMRIATWFSRAIESWSYTDEVFGSDEPKKENDELVRLAHTKALSLVRSVKVPFDEFCFAPRNAESVYRSGYASSFERAVLLGSILREEGFEPHVVFVSKGPFVPDNVPTLNCFGGIALAVPIEGSLLIVDPSESFERDIRLLNQYSVFLHCGYGDVLERGLEVDPHRNKTIMHLSMKLENGELSCDATAEMDGAFSPYWLIKGTGHEFLDYLDEKVEGLFEDALLLRWSIARLEPEHVKIGFGFSVPSLFEESDDRVYIDLLVPLEMDVSGVNRLNTSISKVSAPFYLLPCEMEVDVDFTVPDGWHVVALPSACEMNNGHSILEVEVSQEGSRVKVFRSLRINSSTIEPDQYRHYREALFRFTRSRLVLERD